MSCPNEINGTAQGAERAVMGEETADDRLQDLLKRSRRRLKEAVADIALAFEYMDDAGRGKQALHSLGEVKVSVALALENTLLMEAELERMTREFDVCSSP